MNDSFGKLIEEIHMNNVKKIAILSLVVAVMTGFTQAASHHSGPTQICAQRGSIRTWNRFQVGVRDANYKGEDYRLR